VSAAGYLFILAAVLWIVTAILPLASINKVADAARSAFANCTNPKPDSVANLIKGFTIGATIVFIIIAIGAIILGTFVLRGSRAARIITWVAAGLGVILQGCQGISAGLSGSFSGFNTNSSGSCVDNKALQDQIKAAQPSYLRPISVTLAIIMLLLLIVVIILLALPASHPYFRKGGPGGPGAPGVADPSYPNVPYPPYPGGPSQPGSPPSSPPTAPPVPPSDQPPA
jgi:hypothetical protein